MTTTDVKRALVVIMLLARAAIADPTAEDLYREGQSAYDNGDFPTAIAKWRASFELSRAPGLLFNLAQAMRLSGDCKRAIETYRWFVDADPQAEQRKLAEDLVREMEAKCHDPAPIETQPPLARDLHLVEELSQPEPKPRPPSGRSLKIVGLATGGAGLAAIATGLVVGHQGAAIGSQITAACAAGCDWSAERSRDAAGRRDVAIGLGLDVVGGAAVVGGAVMYYLGYRADVVVAPREGGAIAIWSRTW